MKLQIDSENRTIKIDCDVNLGELVKHLDKLLPKGHPFGHWKDYKLETNTVIYNWNYPIYNPTLIDLTPTSPWNPLFHDQPYKVTCGYTTEASAKSFNGYRGTALTTASSSNVFNVEFN